MARLERRVELVARFEIGGCPSFTRTWPRHVIFTELVGDAVRILAAASVSWRHDDLTQAAAPTAVGMAAIIAIICKCSGGWRIDCHADTERTGQHLGRHGRAAAFPWDGYDSQPPLHQVRLSPKIQLYAIFPIVSRWCGEWGCDFFFPLRFEPIFVTLAMATRAAPGGRRKQSQMSEVTSCGLRAAL